MQGTTILAVKKEEKIAFAGDGQVTLDKIIFKSNANKLRALYKGKVLCGFAGSTADAFALFEKFEMYLEKLKGNLMKAAVHLAKEWRTDKVLRNLQAMLIVGNEEHLLIISGNGDVIEPEEGIAAIGSGGAYALAAARALSENTDFSPREIVEKSLNIASDICIYTNKKITILENDDV